jgi:hypothetical protein
VGDPEDWKSPQRDSSRSMDRVAVYMLLCDPFFEMLAQRLHAEDKLVVRQKREHAL